LDTIAIYHSRKANFNRLFDWRFDKKRVREVRKNRKSKKFKDLLDRHILNYEVGFDLGLDDWDEDLLKNHIPLFGECASNYSMSLFYAIHGVVSLDGGGMGGISFRHSLEEVAKLMKREGFKYKFVKEFIFDFEDRLYKEYSEDVNKE